MIFDFIRSGSVPARTDRHRLAGVLKIEGTPSSRIVAVFDRDTLVLLAMKWSTPGTGEWEFTGLPEYPENSLLVMGLDHTGNYNALAADYSSQVAVV